MRSPIENRRENPTRARRRRTRPGVTRTSELRRIALEALEPRTLLAVLPPAVHDPNVPTPVAISQSGGNHSTPSVAVDPNNPDHLGAAWVRFDPLLAPGPQVIVEAAVSFNGGASWTQVDTSGILADPTTTNGAPFPTATDPSVAFDRSGNFYLLQDQHNGTTSAAFVLSKYSGTTLLFENPVLVTDSQAPSAPILAVDDGVASFLDPKTGQVQLDNSAGNVYVAWASNHVAPASVTNQAAFNPNRIEVAASSDGGATFGPIQTVDTSGNTGSQRFTAPQMTVSQGRLPGTLGTNDPGVPGGQVAFAWDDIGTGATAVPIPFDVLDSNRMTGGISQAFDGAAGKIADATDPGNNAPHVKAVSTFPVSVAVDSRFTTLSDLDVTLNLRSQNLADLQIDLVAPDGKVVTLMRNQVDSSGNTISQFVGSAGSNLGINNNGYALGTTFDQEATRALVDTNAAGNGRGATAPYIGNFRPDSGSGSALSDFYGRSAAQVNGTWLLRVTDYRSEGTSATPETLIDWSLKLTSGMAAGAQSVINPFNTVRGAAPTATSATPIGITPAVSLASDNTLGSFSPHQGRLYATYVDRFDVQRDGAIAQGNPADNTDVFLVVSDDGGQTWQSLSNVGPYRAPLNNDQAVRDGFSEATSLSDLMSGTAVHMAGRPQFEPSVAVDQTTGTLVVSYFDARYDAARARVATTVASSIDGGQSFGTQSFANAPQSAFDEIGQKDVVLGPIPDNQSGGNPKTESTYSYGRRQGLAASHGKVYPTWSSNLNGGLVTGFNQLLLDIRVAPMDIAAGPRIISSTMGPVGQPGDTINGNRTADGSPVAQSFIVTFDRPVDPATVSPTLSLPQVTVFQAGFEDGLDGFTIDNSAAGGLWHLSTGRGSDSGHSASHSLYYGQGEGPSGGGNYDTGARNAGKVTSPAITLPTGRPLRLSFDYFLQTEAAGSQFDAARVSVIDLTRGGLPTTIAQNNTGNLLDPSNGFRTFSADLSSFAGDTIQLTFSFDTVDAFYNDFEGWYVDDVTIVQPGVSSTLQVIARDVQGNLLPSQPTITSVTPLDPTKFGATTFLVAFTPESTPGTYSYTVGPAVTDRIRTVGQDGNQMDQNANSTPGEGIADAYAAPTPGDLATLPLIVAGPHVVATVPVLGNGTRAPNPAGSASNPDNLVTNNTVSGIDVIFDRDMEPNLATPTFTGAQVLTILGPTGPISPAAGGFTVTPNPLGTDPDPAHPRTFRVGFPTQGLSGTYTIQLGSGIQDKHGNAVDANLNAGLDALRGTATGGRTAPVTFASTAVPVALPPGRIATSTIDVPDDFVIQGLTLQLDITDSNDPDLQAALIAPDGVTVVQLFTHVGSAGTRTNFQSTIFDDAAGTPIQNGGPPFFGSFNPQQPLSTLVGHPAKGRYTLRITNDSTTNSGTLNGWSLTFRKPVPGTGLGEPVADRTALSFRIFTMDPTNPLSSNTWTAVGPASIGGSNSGRIGGLALDPSDPSGNTVFVGGASGGVWKTTNFLTTNPQGPTYLPVTDFGPTFGMNIGSLAVFGRNNDPNQSIVFAATGEGDTGTPGVGVLRSTDGGATWKILDSLTNVDKSGNPLPLTGSAADGTQRDHTFVGSTAFKIVVDPRPTISGKAIAYLALSSINGGTNGGVYRTLDGGDHWQLMRAGQATDLALDPNSGFVNAASNPTGNLQIVYAGFQGEGVFISSNQAQGWTLMVGGGGDPLIQDADKNPPPPVAVNAPGSDPSGGKGRIVLAKPALTGEPLKDLLYEGWLYAAVATPDSHLDGLYLTKDFGRNWTKIHLANRSSSTANSPGLVEAVPTNDFTLPDYDPFANSNFAQGNYDISLAIDPTNPNVVYLGGSHDVGPTGLLRVDTTGLSDPYALYLNNSNPDGGQLRAATNDPVTLEKPNQFPLISPTVRDPRLNPTINFIQDPVNPFVVGSTHYVTNTIQFANSGAGARWTPFDDAVNGTTDQHRVFSFTDPTTGRARLVFGDDQGVFTAVDKGDGTRLTGIGSGGSTPVVNGSRNGNLQITQFYYGAAQPSNLAAQVAVLRGMFYGSAQDDGFPQSDPNIIGDPTRAGYGNITWNGPGGDGGGVATDQTGSGNVYQYKWPCCGGNITDFFQLNQVGRTTGLVQRSQSGNVPDPQWPFLGVVNFAVNPVNGDQVIISSVPSSAGPARVFRTETAGKFWLPIADPSTDSTLDGAQSLALAYGAPDPNAPGGVGSLDNFIYFGTESGHLYVTFTGGGPTGGQWVDISAGLDGSPVRAIVTNPTRGSHEAYAVTTTGVFHMVDSGASGAQWVNISGSGTASIFQVMQNAFGSSTYAGPQASYLTSIQADWRYVIPDDFTNPSGSTHPMLYVGGEGGVYRSLDNGQSWTHFPDVALNNTPQEPAGPTQSANADPNGGYLPNAHVTELGLSLGAINPTTGRPVIDANSPNILMATTYGRGAFAIRLAPIVFPNTTANPSSLHFDLTLPNPPGPPNGSDSGVIGDGITNVTDPVLDGLSEQSAFGNVVTVSLVDLTNPSNPVPIPIVAGTGQTNASGQFSVQIAPGYFKTDGSTDGPKVIGVQATDQTGTKGNIALFNFTLDTTAPAVPGVPVLEAASDSGVSSSDNITNVANGPVFDVAPAEAAPTTILLYRDGQLVGTRTGPGAVADTLLGPVPDGVHVYTAAQQDVAGNIGPQSAGLSVTIDTAAPATPSAPTLDLADDTGVKGDGQTQVRQPHLRGTLAPEAVDPIAQITLFDSNNNAIGTAFSTTAGAWVVQPTSPLKDGTYTLKAQAGDIAGNLSGLSTAFVLTINNTVPKAPTIALDPADDTGISNSDDITKVTQPHLIGSTDPGLNVDLIDTRGEVSGTAGAVLGTVLADGDGNYRIQFASPLKDGVYHVQTQARDVVDNKALSPVLTLTIMTKAPTVAPTLSLLPADDTGVKGDGVTVVRRPHLVGTAQPNSIVSIIDSRGMTLVSVPADAAGHYVAQLPNDLSNGVLTLRAEAQDLAGNVGPVSPAFPLSIITVAGDYDGDGRADVAVTAPSSFQFLINNSSSGGRAVPFGGPGDLPIQGDFDGDGRTDVAVYRPTTAQWFILRSSRGPYGLSFGWPGVDIPVVGDYDGDGQSDIALYRPTTGQWLIAQSSGPIRVASFGWPGVDRPEPGDYDGDGKTDLAVYRPTTGQWLIQYSSGGAAVLNLGGQPGDIAVPGVYDGQGKTEPAIYRPSTAQWFIMGPGGVRTVSFGAPNLDIPTPRDYDGDGNTDIAVYRPTTSQWLILGSSSGGQIIPFGAPNLTLPVPRTTDYLSLNLGLAGQAPPDGIRVASLDLGGQALGLASGSGQAGVALGQGAIVVIPNPAQPGPENTRGASVTPPALPPGRSAIRLAQARARQALRLVAAGDASHHHPNVARSGHLHPHPHQDAQDLALSLALGSLGGRVKAGRLLPGQDA